MSDYWKIPKIWEGVTCFILGGGPSLSKVPFSRLYHRRVIAINDAYKFHQWDCMYFKDEGWFYRMAHKFGDDTRTNEECLKNFTGLKVTNCMTLLNKPGLKVLRRGQPMGIEINEDSINQGSNAGQEAIILAIRLGVAKIILLGYDMQVVDGRHNYHSDHTRVIPEHVYADQFIPRFKELNRLALERNVEIVNCTEGSELKEFSFGKLDDYL